MKCTVCGTEFEAKRDSAKYCSPRCRVTASRLSVTNDPNITLTEPIAVPVFEFTVKTGPEDKERELVEGKNKVRTAVSWYDVPLAAVPVLKKDYPTMPDFMNGRQYFLWWKNEFKTKEDGTPIIHNPFPKRDNITYVQAGEGSRRYGA